MKPTEQEEKKKFNLLFSFNSGFLICFIFLNYYYFLKYMEVVYFVVGVGER